MKKPAPVAGFLLAKAGEQIYSLLFFPSWRWGFTLIAMQNNRYHSVTRIYT
ncbi:MAG: hypothetical protein GXW94_05295 [Serratia liquefaciens]|nr:hypothetical protein [Serratia liquefaciens]